MFTPFDATRIGAFGFNRGCIRAAKSPVIECAFNAVITRSAVLPINEASVVAYIGRSMVFALSVAAPCPIAPSVLNC